MLKYVDTLVTFSEIPDEISLCINISNCQFRCKGCHSQYLWQDIGSELTLDAIDTLVTKNPGISCVCFMGGDTDEEALQALAQYVKDMYQLKVARYSGQKPKSFDWKNGEIFDFIKLGPYIKKKGPLTSPTTNQRFYVHIGDTYKDITKTFWEKN